VFEAYHADPAVSRILGKYLVIVDVDIVKNPGGKEMYEKYGTQRGVPAWTVLDASEKVLDDSGDGKDNVGLRRNRRADQETQDNCREEAGGIEEGTREKGSSRQEVTSFSQQTRGAKAALARLCNGLASL
jgi:hypothetical protein